MTVHDTLDTLVLPRQAGPADPPLSAPLPAAAAVPPTTAGRLGRDRPLTEDERTFLVGTTFLFLFLGTIIVTFLLLAEFAWS